MINSAEVVECSGNTCTMPLGCHCAIEHKGE